MIPALAAIFGAGAVCSMVLARVANRLWIWVAAFFQALLLFHELSFALLPPAEWFRMDLLLTLPLFTAGNLFLAVQGWRQAPGWWVVGLAVTAAVAPAWFFLIR